MSRFWPWCCCGGGGGGDPGGGGGDPPEIPCIRCIDGSQPWLYELVIPALGTRASSARPTSPNLIDCGGESFCADNIAGSYILRTPVGGDFCRWQTFTPDGSDPVSFACGDRTYYPHHVFAITPGSILELRIDFMDTNRDAPKDIWAIYAGSATTPVDCQAAITVPLFNPGAGCTWPATLTLEPVA